MIVLPAKETLHGKMNLIQTIGKLFFSFNSELIFVKEYTGVPIEITHSPPPPLPHDCRGGRYKIIELYASLTPKGTQLWP